MDFKFNFLSRGQLESLSLDKIFLTVFKILPFLPLLLECSARGRVHVVVLKQVVIEGVSERRLALVF